MLKTLRNTALTVAALAAATFAATSQRAEAQSYQIDCAILLCLSGGWPASVPCARARAEFIRRITPWPVEPPLQIWRCPMSAAYTVDPETLTADRIYEILLELDDIAPQQSFPINPNGIYDANALATMEGAPSYTFPSPLRPLTGTMEPQPAVVRMTGGDAAPLPEGFTRQLVQDRADIDIIGAEFNFVRSIRVFDARWVRQSEGRDDCRRSATIYLGTYGTQGDFSWRRSSVGALPDAHVGTERYGDHCPSIFHRSVFVEWRDYEGNYGYEQVNY